MHGGNLSCDNIADFPDLSGYITKSLELSYNRLTGIMIDETRCAEKKVYKTTDHGSTWL